MGYRDFYIIKDGDVWSIVQFGREKVGFRPSFASRVDAVRALNSMRGE